jgi:hypothetical protein
MQNKYNAFANKVLFWPLLNAGYNSVGMTKDKIIETIYQEALYLLAYSAANNNFGTFNMVCIRLNEIKFNENIKNKTPQIYENILKAKGAFLKEIEKRRAETKKFEEYWQRYMLGRGK